MTTPFLVISRSNRRVLHEAATLAEARGFSEGHSKPTAIAMVAETCSRNEWSFRIEVVNTADGRVLARSAPLDFMDAVEEFIDAKLMLVPASLCGSEVQE